MAKSTSTEVALIGASDFPVLDPGSESAVEMAEVMAENFGRDGVQAFDLDRVTIPAGGGTTWEIPSLDGIESAREIEGVIVAWETNRSYWELGLEEAGGGGNPPDCASADGVHGVGRYGPGSPDNPEGLCEVCPMNQWGSSGDGRGKACAEQRRLFMLTEGRVLPITVSLPPTSIQPLRKYFLRLAGGGVPYYGVVTGLGLRKVEGNGVKYSVVEPRMVGKLEPSVRAQAKAYGERLKSTFSEAVPRTAESAPAREPEQAGADVPPGA